jgi:hypothetical protein
VDDDSDLSAVRRVLIVMRQPLTKFARRHADDRVGIRIVVGRPSEDLHPEGPLIQGFIVMVQRPFGHEPQKCAIALALAEQRISQQALDLGPFLTQGTDLFRHG